MLTRWRSEKNKVKIVFKLQFHATQLPQLGGDALMISVVPSDIGKPTSRLEKAKVKDGSCYWEKPLYETVKLSQDPKSGKFYEKIYHFVVAKDFSRFGGIGEVSIDFANYAETSKLSSLSLPLKNANSTGFLHVLIQRVQGSFEQREIDGSDNASHRDRSLTTHFGNGGLDGNIRSNDHGTLSNGTNKDHRASSGNSDIMLSSSDSSSGLDTPIEHEPKHRKPAHEPSITVERSSQWNWLNGSAPKLERANSSVSTFVESSEDSTSPDIVIQKLKVKVTALTRQADLAELELQTLRKQIVKEMKKGRDLSREVANLEEERNALKEVKVKVNGTLPTDEGDPWALLNELRRELNAEKESSSDLRLQLQKTQELNAELSLELEKSKSKFFDGQRSNMVGSKSETDDDEEQRELEAIVREHSGTKETYLLEQKIVDLYGEIELNKREKDELETQIEQIALDYEILKQENHEMLRDLERSQLQEQLKIQYECTSYATLHELETQIEILEADLRLRSKELSESVLVIRSFETRIESLEEDLESQARGFEADLEKLMDAKTEVEKRAIRAEENLRKMRSQNANAAARLQEELRRLSRKMASSFEVNEKAAVKAVAEADKLRVEKRVLEDLIVKMKEDLEKLGDGFQEKLNDLSNRISRKSEQLDKMKKEVENMAETERLNGRMMPNHEGERSKEVDVESSDLYLLKEKDLQLEIKEFERKLDVLVQKTETSQVAIAENSNPTMKSNNSILTEMKKTEDQEDLAELSKKMTSLNNENRLMEVEPKEIQEKYSELKFP